MALPAPWKLSLKPASYNGVTFHVEIHSRASGRRKALHEFPKRDTPYLEDMGRRARRFSIVAYVIGPDFEDDRDSLIEQLEAEGNGQLVHPTYTDVDSVGVDAYTVTERREQGGYAVFEIGFVEGGSKLPSQVDSQGAVSGAADSAVPKATSLNGNDFSGSSDITQLA